METFHGKNFQVSIGKDLMRTFIKYLENQGYVTSKTGRRYYIIGFEAMLNDYKSKAERYKYYFFDKEELIEQFRLKDYDDLILLFKFKGQWFISMWRIEENEMYLVDYRQNTPEVFNNVMQIIKDFHNKFFYFKMPSKGIILLPDNYSYRVQDEKQDDTGDLCMAFLFFYIIGSLIIEIKLNPPKRANFSLAFGWLLLKIYQEEEYNFKKNINKAIPSQVEILIQKDSTIHDSLSEELKKRDLQELEQGYGFRDIFMADGMSKLPIKDSTVKNIIRKTPIPNKEDIPSIEETEQDLNQSNEEFRKKVVVVASSKDREELEQAQIRSSGKYQPIKPNKILNSFEIEPYQFNKNINQDQSPLKKPAFNQQDRRSAGSNLNKDSFSLKHDNYWENLQKQTDRDEPNSLRKPIKNQAQQLQKAGDQVLSNSRYFSNSEKSLSQNNSLVVLKQQIPSQNSKQMIPQISKQEFEKQKKVLEDKLQQINNQFVKKDQILDILDDIRNEVNFEMRIQMRKIAEDIKIEQEKKVLEDELRKKHFEDYFKFLLNYYQQHDIQQYYQLLEEYNTRIRQFAVQNLPDSMFASSSQLPPKFNQPTLSTAQSLYQSNILNSYATPQQNHKSSEKLYDGYFNRGSMKYATPFGAKSQDIWSIEPKYLDSDNNFNSGNLKVPKNAEFNSPGLNGFAISPEKAEKYKNRTEKYLNDDMKFGQSKAEEIQKRKKKQEIVERIKEQIQNVNNPNSKGLKLFGSDYYKQQKMENQINQEIKFQQLLANPNNQASYQNNQRISSNNYQTNLSDQPYPYMKVQDTYTSKVNQNTISSDYKTFRPSSQSVKYTNNTQDNYY